jgi:hypothetical protein
MSRPKPSRTSPTPANIHKPRPGPVNASELEFVVVPADEVPAWVEG